MNIAITANTAWNLYNFRKSLIELLIAKGHNVYAIAPEDDAVQKLTSETSVSFIALNQLSHKGSNPFQDLKLIAEYRKIYMDYDIDIAIQYTIKPNIYGSIAGARAGTKTISNLTGLGYVFLNKSIKNKIAKRLYKFSLKNTNFACFHNAIDAKLYNELKLSDPNKIKIINGFGVDNKYFTEEPRSKNNKLHDQ